MRVFYGGIATETNTFSPLPTGKQAFGESRYPAAGPAPVDSFLYGPLSVELDRRSAASGWTVMRGLCAFAQPGGRTTRAAWTSLRDELLADLQNALPVDIVLLGLHGAMVADGCDDCEGELLREARRLAGPDAIIGASLDPHGLLSDQMVTEADILVSYKEYPHTDIEETVVQLVELCSRIASGEANPVSAVHDCGMLALFHTTREPMRQIVADMRAAEASGRALNVSFMHSFPWADVPDAGAKVLVTHDGDLLSAETLAREFAARIHACRGNTSAPALSVSEAVEEARREVGWPLIIAEAADNPGGGAAGDGTILLRALLDAGLRDIVAGPMWDPVAVSLCFEAGEGACIPLRIGGKAGAGSGLPLDVEATVQQLVVDAAQSFVATKVPMGASAAVGIRFANGARAQVVLVSRRGQGFGRDLFTSMGIRLETAKRVLVKSSHHFHADFSLLSQRIVYVHGPGTMNLDVRSLPYRRVNRELWPLCDDDRMKLDT
ncbi:MAG: M81 family metallopeptidase [Betaproteobacteria bacterium]|nr:M81 family metallopeptidase [Betaproteobacteria bacterium]